MIPVQCDEYLVSTVDTDVLGPPLLTLKGFTALAITPSHQQNTQDFAEGRKNINGIFNNYVFNASHMRSGLHFQNG